MNTKFKQAILGGIVGTAIMTIVGFMAPMMGVPKMNPAEMLSNMMGFPLFAGWMMHFMIGIFFAMTYAFLFMDLVKKVSSSILKGIIFGIAVFLFAQVIMGIMGAMIGQMSTMESNMMAMIGGMVGHIFFGITVAMFVTNSTSK